MERANTEKANTFGPRKKSGSDGFIGEVLVCGDSIVREGSKDCRQAGAKSIPRTISDRGGGVDVKNFHTFDF